MTTALVDFGAGNLHSAQKAFQRMAAETDAGLVIVTGEPDVVTRADRIVLPGDGAFAACKRQLAERTGLFEAIEDAVKNRAVPFMGICVGMQMMATLSREYEDTDGFGWIKGEVVRIAPSDHRLKVPHMGWNDLVVEQNHPVLDGVRTGDHAYFVHSYHFVLANPEHRIACTEYGGDITAIVARDTMIGTQFHPEKSQSTGLRLISNFLGWRP